jgi:(S)-sulfolactate dehydrogenase
MPDVVITEFMDQTAVDNLSAQFDVHYASDLVDRPAELAEALAGARAVIVRNRTQVNQELLNCAPKLQVVGRLGVGLDNIDLQLCEQAEITVYPATGANDIAVAEYVITAALLLLRNAYAATEQVVAGSWPRQACIGQEIHGTCLGLVGYGNIAQETAKRARAFGMQVIAYDPYLPAEDQAWAKVGRVNTLQQVLGMADVISLHVPLTDTTRNLIDAEALCKLKPGALLINTARGGIVDEAALVAAMQAGHVAGAALDVFAHEPVDENIGRLFSDIPNLLLTPHIAGVTAQSNVRVSAMIAEKVASHLRGIQ